jgi:hypothetical protein
MICANVLNFRFVFDPGHAGLLVQTHGQRALCGIVEIRIDCMVCFALLTAYRPESVIVCNSIGGDPLLQLETAQLVATRASSREPSTFFWSC